MKNFGKIILKYVGVGLLAFILSVILLTYFNLGQFAFDIRYISNGQALIFTFFACAALLLYDLMRLMDGKGKKKSDKAEDKATDKRGKEVNQFFDRDFVTNDELKTNKAYNYHTLSTIRSCKKDGILVRAEEKGNNMEINFVEPIHTLCVGTTSSGKTSRFVVPSIQLMSMTAAKPSFVVTDPKGELHDKCKNKLIKEGYDVRVINLRDPFTSIRWNPLSYPYQMNERRFNLDKEVKVHAPGDNPNKYNLILQKNFNYTTSAWFEFDGKAYVDKDVLENDMRVLAKKLEDDVYSSLNDICVTLAPVESAKDPNWEKSARRLIHAVLLAMLEDSRIPELGLTEEKFNFFNVYKICNTTDTGRDTYATLKNYLFNYRDQFSKVADLAATTLQNAENTSKNYMGFVSSMVSIFSDTGISFLTSKSEADFVDIDERPTAIFLIIPDEIRVRYPLAILFVTQLYKRLVEKAQNLGGRLKRNVYFMLDEFGNMPKFPEFGTSMAVGRSRGIFFELCVQSYSQLYQVYGQEEGKIIKDNCPIQVYIATEDTVTNKEFSELLGKKTISSENVSVSKGPDGKETKNISHQIQSIPIVYPEQLPTFRDEGKIAIKTFTPNACLKTSIESIYTSKSNAYDLSPVFGTYIQRRNFDESQIFYDIKTRNKLLASKNNDDDDDDFDDLF